MLIVGAAVMVFYQGPQISNFFIRLSRIWDFFLTFSDSGNLSVAYPRITFYISVTCFLTLLLDCLDTKFERAVI